VFAGALVPYVLDVLGESQGVLDMQTSLSTQVWFTVAGLLALQAVRGRSRAQHQTRQADDLSIP
jgi:hypothetical protein